MSGKSLHESAHRTSKRALRFFAENEGVFFAIFPKLPARKGASSKSADVPRTAFAVS